MAKLEKKRLDIDWITSFDALASVFIDGAFSNIAINDAVKKRADSDHAFVRQFVKGTISQTIRTDHIIDDLSSKGIKCVGKRALIVLRMGIYALERLDSIPDYAAVDKSVALAKAVCKGESGFVNAILRSYLREKDRFNSSDPVYKYSFSRDMAGMLIEQYGADEAERIMDALNSAPMLSLRSNGLKISRDELLKLLGERGYDVYPDPDTEAGIFAKGAGYLNDELYRQGYYSIQTASSIECVEAMGLRPGCDVLDICAAPGGKSAYMAEIMKNEGKIIAADIYEHRLELIEKNAARLGIDIIQTELSDGTLTRDDYIGRFDYVLCDVPCSGIGVISSKPEIKLHDISDLSELYEIQLSLLSNAYLYAKEGGRIVYSTCTLNKAENVGVIERFAGDNPDARVVEMKTILPYNNKVGFFRCIIDRSSKRAD